MIARKLPLLLPFFFLTEAQAQKTVRVVDLSTNRPLRHVEVTIKTAAKGNNPETLPDSATIFRPDDIVMRTDYKGEATIPKDCAEAIFYNAGYEILKLKAAEIPDTVALLPKYNLLSEVVVIGHRPDKNSLFKLNKTDAQLLQAQPQGFNLLGIPAFILTKILPKRHKVNKDKIILENY